MEAQLRYIVQNSSGLTTPGRGDAEEANTAGEGRPCIKSVGVHFCLLDVDWRAMLAWAYFLLGFCIS